MPRFLLSLPFLFSIYSASVLADFQVDVITDQLQRPWGIAQLPDKRFLVTEKSGRLRIVDVNGEVSRPLVGLPEIDAVGQGGLLDVVLHPDFDKNQWLYLSYVSGNTLKGYGTEVLRAILKDEALTDIKQIFVAQPKVRGGRHFGSRLVFDDKGYLFISLGDRGQRHESQNLKSHIDSIVRLHDDGAIPTDNPFLNTPGALPEIYSYGHRNVQGMTFNTDTRQLWSHEHGPQGGDEVNIIEKGKNYGWPTISYGVEYGLGLKIGEGTEKSGLEQPILYWTSSIAPSGMAVFQGRLWVGALKYQMLVELSLEGNVVVNEQRLFEKTFGRIRDVKAFDNTSLYLLTDSQQGKLIRLTKKEK